MRTTAMMIPPRQIADALYADGIGFKHIEDDGSLGDVLIRLAPRMGWRLSRLSTEFDAIRFAVLVRYLGGAEMAA